MKIYIILSHHNIPMKIIRYYITAVKFAETLLLFNILQVQAELQRSFLKRMIFNMGMRAKETEIKKSIVRKNSIWDKIVFKKIQDTMGGRLRLMLVGSAPLAGNVLTFTRCALGCLVIEGYGQTECCAPITLTIQVCIEAYEESDCRNVRHYMDTRIARFPIHVLTRITKAI